MPAKSKGSSKTLLMPSLTFADRLCDKYPFLICWLILTFTKAYYLYQKLLIHTVFVLNIILLVLILLALWNKTDTCANSVDPDETAHLSRLIKIYTVCHFSLYFA